VIKRVTDTLSELRTVILLFSTAEARIQSQVKYAAEMVEKSELGQVFAASMVQLSYFEGHAITQMVSRWLPTAAARVQNQV
jgi:hypothetical protein